MAEQARVKAQNDKVAGDGANECGQRFSAGGFNPARVACLQEYVTANAAKEKPVPDELYKFDFVSPTWSADLAGVSLVVSVIFGFLTAAQISWRLIKRHVLDVPF